MGDLRNNFYKSTGLTYDIEKFLENLPEEQKIKMFKKLKWQMNSGILMDNVKSEKSVHQLFRPRRAGTCGN